MIGCEEGGRHLDSAWWAARISLFPVSEILFHPPHEIKAWRNSVKKAGYLNFRDDRAFLCTGAGEGCQWGWRHDRIGAGEIAQVAAGNLILLMSHDDGFHDKEAIPRQPEGVLLCDERCPLEPQDDGDAAICDQVKAVWEGRVQKERREGEQEKQETGDEEEEEEQEEEKERQRKEEKNYTKGSEHWLRKL